MATVTDCSWKLAAERLEAVVRPRVEDVIRIDAKCCEGWTWGENGRHLHLRTGVWTGKKVKSGSMRSDYRFWTRITDMEMGYRRECSVPESTCQLHNISAPARVRRIKLGAFTPKRYVGQVHYR